MKPTAPSSHAIAQPRMNTAIGAHRQTAGKDQATAPRKTRGKKAGRKLATQGSVSKAVGKGKAKGNPEDKLFGKSPTLVPLHREGNRLWGLKKPFDVLNALNRHAPVHRLSGVAKDARIDAQGLLGGEEKLDKQGEASLTRLGAGVDNEGFHGARAKLTSSADLAGLVNSNNSAVVRAGLEHATGLGASLGLTGADARGKIGGGIDAIRAGYLSEMHSTDKLPLRIRNEFEPEAGVGAHAGAGAMGLARLDKGVGGDAQVRLEAGGDVGLRDRVALTARSGREIVGVEGGIYGSAGAGVSGSAGIGFNTKQGFYVRFRKIGAKVGLGAKGSLGFNINPIGLVEAGVDTGLSLGRGALGAAKKIAAAAA